MDFADQTSDKVTPEELLNRIAEMAGITPEDLLTVASKSSDNRTHLIGTAIKHFVAGAQEYANPDANTEGEEQYAADIMAFSQELEPQLHALLSTRFSHCAQETLLPPMDYTARATETFTMILFFLKGLELQTIRRHRDNLN